MSTGPKRIKTRTNVHPRAGKQPEKRGGARAGAGRPSKVVRAKAADLRIEFIERLKIRNPVGRCGMGVPSTPSTRHP